jgi:hypothetical protein
MTRSATASEHQRTFSPISTELVHTIWHRGSDHIRPPAASRPAPPRLHGRGDANPTHGQRHVRIHPRQRKNQCGRHLKKTAAIMDFVGQHAHTYS